MLPPASPAPVDGPGLSEEVSVLAELMALVARARTLVGDLEPDTLSGPEARTVVEQFVELEKLAGAGRTLAVGRLDRTGAWVGDGSFRDIESWVAAIAGTTVGAARAAVGTARRVIDLPETAAAMRSGALSPAQAEHVSTAAALDPAAEQSLLDTAGHAGLKGLRLECDRVAAAARSDEVERYERIHSQRCVRHRRFADGTGQIDVRGPLDRTAQIMAALEPYEQELFEANRAQGRLDHPDAVAFDALVQLAAGSTEADPSRPTGRTRAARALATVVVHVSKTAYERGMTEAGEICEIEGAGPIPVGVARRLTSDAILTALVTDGVDVTRVAHLGRTIPAHVRTAVQTRDRACVIEGCEVDRHLEIDHNVPFAEGGPTTPGNLGRVCHHHHDLKTRRDLRRVGLLGRQRLVSAAEYARAGP